MIMRDQIGIEPDLPTRGFQLPDNVIVSQKLKISIDRPQAYPRKALSNNGIQLGRGRVGGYFFQFLKNYLALFGVALSFFGYHSSSIHILSIIIIISVNSRVHILFHP
jgi:hypothetical protein